MGYTDNQVRHLYVAKTIVETAPVNEGDLQLVKQGNTAYFKYMSPNKQLVVSDKIDLDKIEYVKTIQAAKMQKKLKKHTITLTENPIAGQEYIIRLTFKNYIGIGDNNMAFKYGMGSGATKTALLADLEKSLKANLKDVNVLAEVKVEEETLVITEVAQDWVRGKMAKAVIPFEVDFLPINIEGVETTDWATETKSEGDAIPNGYDVADMEYFYMGNRGDIYRGMGYPHNIETTYLVKETDNYNVLEIHYSYVGANESVQKSEKDITIVSTEDLGAIETALAGKE